MNTSEHQALRHRSRDADPPALGALWPDAHFSPIERALLAYLLAAGRAVPHDELLREVWGYQAGTRTRTVRTTVQRVRLKIEPVPSAPRHLVTVAGEGYRLHPPLPRPDAFPRPSTATAMFGRDDDLADLVGRLEAGTRLITVHGAGGLGKTRLAREVMGVWEAGGRDALFCDLTEARGPRSALAALARCLSVRLHPLGDPTPALAAALATRKAPLVVLDNAEQLDDEGVVAIGGLAEATPEARFLVTSRARLRIASEALHPLAPLAAADALALLRERIEATRVDRESALDLDALREVVDLLDGVPLALEMAAARARIMSPDTLRARLRTSLAGLRLDRRDAPERHRTLGRTIDWSWRLLSASERDALIQLAVFRGGFTLAAAEATLDADDPLSLLGALLDRAMVQAHDTAAGRRFRLFESVRAFVIARGDATLVAARARHAAWAVEVARRGRSPTYGRDMDVDLLITEQDNLLAALEVLGRDGAPGTADVLRALHGLHGLIGVPADFEAHARWAVDRADAAGAETSALRLPLAWTLLGRGDVAGAETEAKRALTTVPADAPLRHELLRCLTWAVFSRGARDAALAHAEEAVALAERLGAPDPQLYQTLGAVLSAMGDLDGAVTAYRRALDVAEATGARNAATTAWCSVANLHAHRWELDLAQAAFMRAAALGEALGDTVGRVHIDAGLAHLAALRGEHAAADRAFQRVLEDHARLGRRVMRGATEVPAAYAALLVGATDRATDLLTSVADAHGVYRREALALLVIAAFQRGDPAAVERAAETLAASDDAGDDTVRRVAALALAHRDVLRARVALLDGRPADAAAHRARAEAARVHEAPIGDVPLAARLLSTALASLDD